MSAKELAEWEAFYLLEPFGEYQTNYAAGVVASTIANIYRKKNSKLFTPDDFMPKRGLVYESPKKQSVEQQALILRGIASIHKKQKKKKKKKKSKRKKVNAKHR